MYLTIQMLWAFIKSRRAVYFVSFAIWTAFILVYLLYGYDFGIAAYSSLLTLSILVFYSAYGFIKFSKKCDTLCKIVGRYPVSELPEPSNLAEKYYTDIIECLEEERERLYNENRKSLNDAMQYYTLWVHQIKTPISAMRLLLQSGADAETPDHRILKEIEPELFSIEQYVGMVLQYQRLANFSGDLLLKNYSVETMVKQAVKKLAPIFISKKISLELSEMEYEFVTDQKWFVFILEQVLTNALKYTKQGTISIFMREPGLLEIKDTGIGISKQDLPRVMEHGFTGNAGRTDMRSSGIGLFLCSEIAKRLEISIAIESELGTGTSVLLNISQAEFVDF